jgi:hypothetical protein
MSALVTIEQAKISLRLTDTDDYHFPNVEMKMEQATDIVVDYIKRPEHGWTDGDAPPIIQAAVLEVLRRLFEGLDDPLSNDVKNILRRYRDPALA